MAGPEESFVFDHAYQKKVTDLLIEALFKGLMESEPRRVVLRTGDICEVMLKLEATLLAGASFSPTSLRKWTEEYGRRLYRTTLAARARNERQGSPFQHVNIDGELN